MGADTAKKTCFVVMGFGTKTDFQQQKPYDLDKTYRIIIKKAVEEAGLKCVRADEVMHAGIIDKPMYELLLSADLVVADLSTSNANAIYELGVRHALRPHTTIVIAESNFKFPFDIGHLLVRPYRHMGEGIDAEDAERTRGELIKAIQELMKDRKLDSPVYTFLPGLSEPCMAAATTVAAGKAAAVAPNDNPTVGVLLGMFHKARAASNWGGVKSALTSLKDMLPHDPFVLQQLAFATYKDKKPDAKSALEEAKNILGELQPATTNDSETTGIWGAIHKRLWELTGDRATLDEAIRSYGKGFYLKDDHYNGINYAFVLDARASVTAGREAIADVVWAERVRLRVLELCEAKLSAGIKNEQGDVDREQTFWLRATKVEALIGTGQTDRATEAKAEACCDAPEAWMVDSMNEQLDKLQKLIAAAPKSL